MISYLVRLLSLCTILPILTACQSTYQNNTQFKAQYLQKFIGQSPQQIQSRFSLNHLNYRATQAPRLLDNQLIYTYSRPLLIPFMDQRLASSAGTVPIPVGMQYTVDNYSIECQIIFYFEAQRATDVSSQGTGC